MDRTVYLIRHGETDMNREERLQGQIDSELNPTGIAEAQSAARRLHEAGIRFDRIYTSPLRRAARTADIIAEGGAVTVEPLITEMHFGSFEGMPYGKIDGKMWDFIHDPEHVPPPEGVESIQSLTGRTGSFLRRIISDSSESCILAVTHGIALRSMLWNLYGEDSRAQVWGMPIENCVIYTFRVTDGKVTGIRRADELSQKSESDTSAVF
ncbi:MAG: histidine phosphatase family protein [Ruminiclostridium sp.]|nr:histidine phosphatase family protein [Ruminiclostridium sp.]